MKNRVKIFPNRVQISLPNNKFFLIDHQDLPLVRQSSWQYSGRSLRPNNAYVKGYIGGRSVSLHRLLLGAKAGEIVDHISGRTWDNRRKNLRIATKSQNARNRRSCGSKTLPIGVVYRKERNAYIVRMKVDGKMKKMGYFKSWEEATNHMIELKNKHYGEFSPHWGKDAT